MLLKNREKQNVFLVTNKPANSVAAMTNGFGVIPVLHSQPFELLLVESYLLM